jgi:carboxyl-terminal processing protease
VAGSLQDFDRAVIIGQKTFGKGLVQSTRALPYGAKLKITTAKYYIPSGRCIQAINYAEKNEDGSVKKIPDSLKVAFKTVKSGRVVYDGGGIDPDIAIEPEKLSALTFSLLSKNLIFDYATVYRVKNPQIGNAKNFVLSDVDYNDFVQWLSKKEYDYTTRSEKTLEAVKAAAEKDNYFEQIKPEYEALKKGLMHDKQNDLMKEKEQIKSLLEEEIAARYYYNTGRIEASLKSDREIKKAIEVLSDESQVKTILAKKQ